MEYKVSIKSVRALTFKGGEQNVLRAIMKIVDFLYQLLLDHQVGGHELPDQCLVVAAGNRVSDGAISSEMGTAAADRLTHFQLTVNPQEWLEWAEKKELHPYVLTYIKAYPEELVDEANFKDMVRVTPRSWAVVSDYLYSAEEKGLTETEKGKETLKYLLQGRLGEEHTTTFLQAIKEIRELHPVEEYIKALKSDKKKLLDMAPKRITSNYGLIFSLVRWAETVDDYVDAMLVFKEFCQLNDSVNREENFTSAVTIVNGKLQESNQVMHILKNKAFLRELGPRIRTIPSLSNLKIGQYVDEDTSEGDDDNVSF